MANEIQTQIGRTTHVRGNVKGDGDLWVEGRVEGSIDLKGHLQIVHNGFVESQVGPVIVHHLTTEGQLDADVHAQGIVTLKMHSKVRGMIRTEQLALEDGAKFSGRIEMNVELPEGLKK